MSSRLFFTLPGSVADPGSGIGCLFDPWIRDKHPGSATLLPRSGSGPTLIRIHKKQWLEQQVSFNFFLVQLSKIPHENHLQLNINFPSSAGVSPCISLKIKKRHNEHRMIETHIKLITWISDDSF